MKAAVVALLALVATVSGGPCPQTPTTVSGTQAPQDYCSGDLIFSDEFDTFEHKKWQHENTLGGGGNNEFQWYGNTRSNSYVQNGVMNIRPTFTADSIGYDSLYRDTLDINGDIPDGCTNPQWSGCVRSGSDWNIINPIRSARLRTIDSFSFKYGILEVRAKMPKGDWIWPAIWMLPRHNAYGGWPTSGEIDIVESRGNVDYIATWGQNIGTELAGMTMHWGLDSGSNQFGRTHWERNNGNGYDSEFHTYMLIWTEWDMQFFLDGEEVGRVSPPDGGFWELGELWQTGQPNPWVNQGRMAPFDQEFYIIMNVAVGGTNFFPDDAWNSNGDKPWQNWSPQAMKEFWEGRWQWEPTWQENRHMEVDWIRVYAL